MALVLIFMALVLTKDETSEKIVRNFFLVCLLEFRVPCSPKRVIYVLNNFINHLITTKIKPEIVIFF